MSVVSLITQNFRNLSGKKIVFHPDLNFIVGDNGSGKSSLLEALFYLGHGKSFRTTKTESLVSFNHEQFVANITDSQDRRMGISRNVVTSQTEIKVDGERQSRLSDLAKNIAVQIVTPESFKLFFGGPKERRRFIDLGLFHVKHDFAKQWRDFSKVLKQRNAGIRSLMEPGLRRYWTELFCQHSILVAQSRQEYINEFVEELNIWLGLLLPSIAGEITLQYSRGWSKKRELMEVLNENEDKELKYGSSLYGAHKFDVKFLLHKHPIDFQLSRGQQKLFLLALTFAQAKLIEKVKRVKPILLIDDIGAELDTASRALVSGAIKELNCQVILTAIDKLVLAPLVPSNESYQMFHVEHGEISAISE